MGKEDVLAGLLMELRRGTIVLSVLASWMSRNMATAW